MVERMGLHPPLTTRDRELVSILEVRIQPGDLNLRPLTLYSVTQPTIPRAGRVQVLCLTLRYTFLQRSRFR